MRSRRALALGATVVVAAAAGCGSSSSGSGDGAKPVDPNKAEVSPPGDIPDNQAFVSYTPPSGGYTVKVPEGWARKAAGGSTTLSDKLNSITMEAKPSSAGAARDRPNGARVTTVKRKAGRAVRITYLTAGKPDPVTGKSRTLAVERYVFLHNGRNIVLTLKGAKGADNVDPWKIVTDSLSYTG